MEQLVANLTGQTRRETLNGIEYLIAPATMIVPGVLDGSQGPLLYDLDDIKKSAHLWNGIPVVVNHPKNNVSARSPSILEKQGVGQVFNTEVNGKLTTEVWFDVNKTRKVDSRILTALGSSTPIPLSTGLFTDIESSSGELNGQSYKAIARNYQPDHLAILLDDVGACSVKDGCGVLINQGTQITAELVSAVTKSLKDNLLVSSFSKEKLGKENTVNKEKTIDYLITNCDCWTAEDKEVLNTFNNEKLAMLEVGAVEAKEFKAQTATIKTQEAVINAAKKGFDDQHGNNFTCNVEQGVWEVKKKEFNPTSNSKNTTPSSPEKKITEEEYFNSLPPSIKEDVEFARNQKAVMKTELIDQLVTNLSEEVKVKQVERLQNRTLVELREDVLLLGDQAQSRNDTRNYMGAAVPTSNQEPDKRFRSSILPMPTINWKENVG
jgi:hypothetical protein